MGVGGGPTESAGRVTKEAVWRFWQRHPLGSYAIAAPPGSATYFRELQSLHDACSQFVLPLYRFEEQRGRRVLDVGCGPGWVARQYARAGARVAALDLTAEAVRLARRWLVSEGLAVEVQQADAEALPFAAESFDFVSCDGVLQHTPNTQRGIEEIHRVLRPGCGAYVSLYHENLLLRPTVFPLTRALGTLLRVRMHGVERLPRDVTRDSFVRFYDGVDNPLGQVFPRRTAEAMMRRAGFEIERTQVFYFPARFVPGAARLPRSLRRLLDRSLGTMIAFALRKPR